MIDYANACEPISDLHGIFLGHETQPLTSKFKGNLDYIDVGAGTLNLADVEDVQGMLVEIKNALKFTGGAGFGVHDIAEMDVQQVRKGGQKSGNRKLLT
jgi:hypothetical protein